MLPLQNFFLKFIYRLQTYVSARFVASCILQRMGNHPEGMEGLFTQNHCRAHPRHRGAHHLEFPATMGIRRILSSFHSSRKSFLKSFFLRSIFWGKFFWEVREKSREVIAPSSRSGSLGTNASFAYEPCLFVALGSLEC